MYKYTVYSHKVWFAFYTNSKIEPEEKRKKKLLDKTLKGAFSSLGLIEVLHIKK